MVALIINDKDVIMPYETHVVIKESVGNITQLNFSLPITHRFINEITQATTKIKAFDLMLKEEVFEGRVVLPDRMMGEYGQTTAEFVCEDIRSYLRDGVVYGRFASGNYLPSVVDSMLSMHNDTVSDSSKIRANNIKNIGLPELISFDYVNTLQAMNELAAMLGLEYRVYRIGTELFLDMVDMSGVEESYPIEIAQNMKSIERTPDMSSGVINRIIPVSGIGYNGRRMTVEQYMGRGKIYIDNFELIEKYGGEIHCGVVYYNDIVLKDPSEYQQALLKLFSRGAEDAQALSDVQVSYRVSVLDKDRRIKCGNIYRVINPLIDVDEKLRVIEKETDYDDPYNPTLTFGTTLPRLTKATARNAASAAQVYVQATTAMTDVITATTGGLTLAKLTVEAYNALETKSSTTLYIVTAGNTAKMYIGTIPIIGDGGGGSTTIGIGTPAAKGVTTATAGVGRIVNE